jgi:hypothetical protein
MEDLVYRRLIDLYYLHEEPLKGTPEHLARQIRLRDQTKAVATILEEFFQKEEGGGGVPDNSWRMKRCDEEIVKFQDMREGGKKGAAIRWAKGGNGEGIAPLSPPYEPPNANRKPLTINQEPKEKTLVASLRFEEFWKAYPSDRKQAKKPCMDKWAKLKLDEMADKVISHVESLKRSKSWRDGYSPAPLTYLSQQRWIDGEPEVTEDFKWT